MSVHTASRAYGYWFLGLEIGLGKSLIVHTADEHTASRVVVFNGNVHLASLV